MECKLSEARDPVVLFLIPGEFSMGSDCECTGNTFPAHSQRDPAVARHRPWMERLEDRSHCMCVLLTFSHLDINYSSGKREPQLGVASIRLTCEQVSRVFSWLMINMDSGSPGHVLLRCVRKQFRAGEMAQRLRALAALPEVLSSIPSNHMVAHNHLYWDLVPSSGVQAYMQTEHCIHNMQEAYY